MLSSLNASLYLAAPGQGEHHFWGIFVYGCFPCRGVLWGRDVSYVNAISLFFSEHSVVPLAVETPVYSKRMWLAGTPDLLCEFDGELAILDYKFVAAVAKTRVKAQLNAYREIYADNGVFTDKLYAVQFLPEGRYRLYAAKADNVELDVCLKLRELRNKKHGRGIIN